MFTVEHPGTASSIRTANDINTLIEELGYECEVVVGRYEDDTTVYFTDGEKPSQMIGTFNTSPNSETLRFFIDVHTS